MRNTTTGSSNTAIGEGTLVSNATGSANVAIGNGALYESTADYNTAVGHEALRFNTIGTLNAAFGKNALRANTTGNYNTAVGMDALYSNTIGQYNTAVGRQALLGNTTGNGNTAMGLNALDANTTGSNNVAFGQDALGTQTTGVNNTAVGTSALFSNTSGENVALGYQTLYGATANNAQASSATVSNTITLGNSSIATLRCQQTSITALSDQRDKSNVLEIPVGLDFVEDLRPVTFTWDTRPEYDSDGNVIPNANDGLQEGGFIAQELLATEEKFDTRDWTRIVSTDNEDRLEAAPSKLIPILVKAIQELSAKVAELEAKVK
jgi:hypothetical protein